MANGAESEPASRKDALLLRAAPNLVLDGLQLAAEAIGASEAHLFLHPGVSPEILRALNQRAAAGLDWLDVTDHRGAAAVPGRPGVGAGQPAGRRPGGAHVRAAPGVRTRPGRRAYPGPERRDPGSPGPDRAVRPALVPRPRHRRASRAACSPPCTRRRAPRSSRPRSAPRCAPAPRRKQTRRRSSSAAIHGAWLPIATIGTLTLDNEALKDHGAARRRRRHRRAARRPLRPGRGGPGRTLPGRRVGRAVRPVPQRAAPDGRCPGRTGRARAPQAGPRRPRALGRPGHRPRRLQPPGRHRPVRPQHADRVRAGDQPARPRPAARRPTAPRSCRCPTACR